ncbi:MAG: carboxypeptidase M32 [Leptospiraceae bacterium]|nr:carboxypeptidase M32 [Leptospiraceae bacterium]
MEKTLKSYRKIWSELVHYQDILSLLHWDSEVFMPEDARDNRSEQIAQLSSLCHKIFTGNELSDLSEKLFHELKTADIEPEKKLLLERELEVLKRDRNREAKIPVELVEEFSRTTNLAHGVWAGARKNSNFKEFQEILTKVVSLTKEMADAYGHDTERYDALLEGYEPGTNANTLNELFKSLKNSLIPIIHEGKAYPNPFKREVSEEYQNLFNQKLPGILGLSRSVSRLDVSLHPFSTSIGKKDKRITTRYQLDDPTSSIFGVLHETGHALYELGLSNSSEYPSPLTSAVSYGMHESQSRLWENQVGRGRAFWEYFHPMLLKDFQIYHYDLPFDDFFKFINSVNKTKIRVEADQVTYNLHIIMRFEIERDLISGTLQVADLPEVWNSKMKEYFELQIENDGEGVLQDVHWSGGAFGYFPTYTLGNIYSAQIFHSFLSTHQSFWEDVRTRGDFSSLLKWLGKNIHKKGKFYEPNQLIKEATGEYPDSSYLVRYLKSITQGLE